MSLLTTQLPTEEVSTPVEATTSVQEAPQAPVVDATPVQATPVAETPKSPSATPEKTLGDVLAGALASARNLTTKAESDLLDLENMVAAVPSHWLTLAESEVDAVKSWFQRVL